MLPMHVAAILDQIDELVLAVDGTWRIVYANPAAQRYLQAAGPALVGVELWPALGEPAGSDLRVQCQLAMVDRQPVSFEARTTRLGDYFSVRIYPAPDGGLTLLLQDVSERRGAAEQHARAQRMLETMVEACPLGLCVVDPEGRVELWNPAAEAMFGWTAGEVRGQLLPTVGPAQMAEFRENLRRTLAGGASGALETLRRRKDGVLIDVALWTAPLPGADGRPGRALCIMADTSRQKAVEAELRQTRDAAEAANQSKDQFLAVLSHELRTPLTPVLATTAALLAHPQTPADFRDDLETIQRNVELTARLVDDLLDLTRISRGKLHLKFETLALGPLVARTIAICRPDLAAKDLQFESDLAAAQCHVRGDHARLQQILWNLIKNAVKFTPQQGFIRVWAEQTPPERGGPGRVLLHVSDTGIGIPPEKLGRIFNAFDQGGAGTARTYGGLGLGLMISRALAQLHGGYLTVHSPGRNAGSTFTLELPLTVAPHGAAAPPAGPRAASAGQRILLVEDHHDTARIMARLLRTLGHDVAVAHDVMTALRLAGEDSFDLLISDIGLPDGSGVELMRELKKSTTLRGIALSGYGMEDDVRQCKDAGFAEHLTKPVNLETLERVINQLGAAGDNIATNEHE